MYQGSSNPLNAYASGSSAGASGSSYQPVASGSSVQQDGGYPYLSPATPTPQYPGPSAHFMTPKIFPSHNHTRYLAVFMQTVYVGRGIPQVARVSITDYRGKIRLDTFVRPRQSVSDYRMARTGLKPTDLSNAPNFYTIQGQVADLIRDKVIVGHSLWNFLSALEISHPAISTRDVALFLPVRRRLHRKHAVPLAELVELLMGRKIGGGFEDPLENARAALDIFRSCEDVWESLIATGDWPCTLPPSSFANCFT